MNYEMMYLVISLFKKSGNALNVSNSLQKFWNQLIIATSLKFVQWGEGQNSNRNTLLVQTSVGFHSLINYDVGFSLFDAFESGKSENFWK